MSDKTPQSNPLPNGGLTWFELPTIELDRAVKFYSSVLAEALKDFAGDEPMHVFPSHGGGITGALVHRSGPRGMQPGATGAVVYLHLEGTLNDAMERVVPAGGELLSPAITVPGVPGTFCMIRDTEGNHVGLHAQG